MEGDLRRAMEVDLGEDMVEDMVEDRTSLATQAGTRYPHKVQLGARGRGMVCFQFHLIFTLESP